MEVSIAKLIGACGHRYTTPPTLSFSPYAANLVALAFDGMTVDLRELDQLPAKWQRVAAELCEEENSGADDADDGDNNSDDGDNSED